MKRDCDETSHALARTSIQALSILCSDVKPWPDRPEPGYLMVSGQCRSCQSTIGIDDITDEHWVAATGQPVPQRILDEDARVAAVAEKLAQRMLVLVPA